MKTVRREVHFSAAYKLKRVQKRGPSTERRVRARMGHWYLESMILLG